MSTYFRIIKYKKQNLPVPGTKLLGVIKQNRVEIKKKKNTFNAVKNDCAKNLWVKNFKYIGRIQMEIRIIEEKDV